MNQASETERTGYNVSFAVASVKLIIGTKQELWGQTILMRQDTFHYLNHNKVHTCYERAACQTQSAKGKSKQKITHALWVGNKLDIVSTRLRRKLIIGTNAYTLGARQCVRRGLIIWIITTYVPAWTGSVPNAVSKRWIKQKNHARSLGGNKLRYFQHQVEIGHWKQSTYALLVPVASERSASTEVRFPRRHVRWWGTERVCHQSIQVCTYVVLWLGNG